ncbi:hypothetical protein ACN2C6_13590 [Caulobacter sp. ErkDOM-YI]|uniref:hypothetical protein n=1 Tax=unclassified Caulobacter TaxID=2648921 RepID=UPI003AF5482B
MEPALHGVISLSETDIFSADGDDDWEAQDEIAPSFVFHEDAVTAARTIQNAISAHETTETADDWSEVVVDLPEVARGRRTSVSFRRLLNGRARPSKSLPALDLSKSPDELLSTVSIAQVIRSSDASATLLACVARSGLFTMTALDFLADGDSEAEFLKVPALGLREYFEIVDTLNAFTILVHGSATGSGFRYAPTAEITAVPDALPAPVAASAGRAQPGTPDRSPTELLEQTRLAQIVLRRGSPALQKALRGVDCFTLSAQAFIEHDDAEALFCSARGMNVVLYLELCDLVNDFTTEVFRSQGRR